MRTRKNTISFFVLVLFIFVSGQGFAAGAVGWHWYNEIIAAKNKNENKKIIKKDAVPTAQEQMADLRKTLEEAKAKAILFPTEENIHAYIAIQNFMVQKAALFSKVWQKTLLDYPELDFSVQHPTENNAQHIMYEQEHNRESEVIAAFREKYGMFFFYRGNNALDRELAPTIKSFAEENQISLIPVAVDGKILPIFPESRADSGQAKKLGVVYFPALILVDPAHREAKPLNYGFISQDELRRRFLQVATDFQEGT